MTQTVQLKRSATAGAIPSTSDLSLGELALNTYDGKAYIKKSVGGTESIVEIGADTSTDITAMKHYLYNCSANQTSFSGTDTNGDSLSYTAGQIAVFLNGVFLDPDDYTATNGSTIVLDDGAKSSDYLEIVAWTAGVTSGLITGISNYEFTATANQTVLTGADENGITLSYTPGKVLVFLNGVLMDNRSGTDYTETNASTITFSSGLQVSDTVIVKSYTGSAPFTRFQFDVTASSTTQVSGTDANGTTLSLSLIHI